MLTDAKLLHRCFNEYWEHQQYALECRSTNFEIAQQSYMAGCTAVIHLLMTGENPNASDLSDLFAKLHEEVSEHVSSVVTGRA